MNLRTIARQLPLRLTAGSYVLNSGLSKWDADDVTAKQLQDFAVGTYPFVAKLGPRTFARLLAAGELALGAAVLVLPGALAGAGRRLLRRADRPLPAHPRDAPGGSVRPTERGIALAKDIWLLGIGTSLVVDDLVAKNRTEGKRS